MQIGSDVVSEPVELGWRWIVVVAAAVVAGWCCYHRWQLRELWCHCFRCCSLAAAVVAAAGYDIFAAIKERKTEN